MGKEGGNICSKKALRNSPAPERNNVKRTPAVL